MSRRKKREKPASGGSPGWMTTFSDLTTLLLTFFILLFSMSNVDAQKFRSIANSLSYSLLGGGEGIMEGVLMPAPSEGSGESEGVENVPENVDPTSLDPELLVLYDRVARFVDENGLEGDVAVSADADGIYVNISNSILFGKESVAIAKEGKEALQKLANILNRIDNDIVIEGHTDNIPNAYGIYDTNWELSAGRAVSVLRYMTEELHVKPYRLSAVGYGEFRPLVPNDTAENRAKNRRVNIVVVYEREEADE